MTDDDGWIDEIEEQIERYLADNFPDGLHIPAEVSEDEKVQAVQEQLSEAGFNCPDDTAREIVRRLDK
ncbi:hypothetical protein [Mycobacterium scrofulaceum]|uniref:Uncharacterized protein n=1 Tax=Mycobacterium scrofulaceum TaxID=1783 RepID=A0A1A2VM05_MYCSC|nr:hypothetical protein [Mycobacterium scrofulaceum]OBI01681.1 hypothetical protein A5679_18580 [Mycobacterium scrofulaceum]